MTTGYFPQDDDWYANADWYYEDDVRNGYARGLPTDVIVLGAVALVVLALVLGLSRLVLSGPTATVAPARQQAPLREARKESEAPAVPAAPPATLNGPEAFVMPYTDYILTQGPHGMSYGHYALDIAAGAGEPVLSPITGRVTELYVDGIGNPTLVISNDAYEVTMMHGVYSVSVGQDVRLGEHVGTESNLGNTLDMSGRSCRNRDCGYHTHLNVYDKRSGSNVNPLDLLQ